MNFDDFNNIIVTLDKFKVDNDFILDVHNNHEYNKLIIEYYKKLIEEEGSISKKYGSYLSLSKINDLEKCNKFWFIDRYDSNCIKDFTGTFLCHDKFCSNCKKVKQAVRMSRYIDFIKQYKENLYHCVFTIPNCTGIDLRNTLIKMNKSFRKLMRIIQGNYACFIDFKKYQYLACLRSLEITFCDDIYHPHFHCAFVFKNLDLEKNIVNKYSYSNKSNNIKLFSEFEIILQKLWYMIYNNIALTKKNFDDLECGYSCMVDKFFDDDYMELFKYMTKSTDEQDKLLTYDNFKTLYFATYRFKQIQGYGLFYNITDDDITQDEIDKVYSNIKLFLNSDENPILTSEMPFDLLNDKNYLLISRKKIYQYLKLINNTETKDK